MIEDTLETSFTVPRTLSAMAAKFYVKTPKPMKEKGWYLKEGSTVTGIISMASGDDIHDVKRLVNIYKKNDGSDTKIADWHKVRGTAVITDGKTDRIVEVHWYQCKDIGKVEFKVKRWDV